MAMFAPGWQTDELVEEWPESSPSPPPSLPIQLPAVVVGKQTVNMESIRAKRGSLRMLGQASARPLPPSRSVSVSSSGENVPGRIVSGHVEGGKGHLPSPGHIDVGVLSPPSSRSSSSSNGPPTEMTKQQTMAGTFVVKDGVEDDRGAHLARNGVGPKGGKDIFGALPLERMFDPPSPPTANTVDNEPPLPSSIATSAISTPSPAPPTSLENEPRRVSHPYAPANPSRLSKSVTPSSNDSFTTTASAAPSLIPTSARLKHEVDSFGQDDTVLREDEGDDSGAPSDFVTAQQGEEQTKHTRLGEMSLRSGEVETDLSPPARQVSDDYPFTFNAPRHPSSTSSFGHAVDGGSLVFDPEHDAVGEGPSHSTLNIRSKPPAVASENQAQSMARGPSQQSNPALRLFRSTYDTYTREHLSALVDSIAIEPSPSPPALPNARHLRNWSPAADNQDSPSASGSTPSASSLSSDARSSKRLRLSPPSPPRRGMQLRDWGAQGQAMMDRIRGRDAESTTSASQSRTSGSEAHDTDLADGPTIDYAALPPTPPLDMSPVHSQNDRPTHRSNPSTTSSGYLRAAEDIMARIKSRKVSESASGADSSPVTIGGRRVLSESDENRMWEEEAGHYSKTKGKAKGGPSPRRMLRRLSASEEVKRVAEADSGSGSGEEQPLRDSNPRPRQRLDERRPTSRASATSSTNDSGAPQPPHLQARAGAGFSADDLNRYMSSSTHATSTTLSTSFVKHRGPRAAAGPGAGMRMIRPDDVQGVVPDRIGKMRFDRNGMRWVREELGAVDEAGESRAGGSEESVDVFAGMESLPEDADRRQSSGHEDSEHRDEDSISSTSASDNEDVLIHHHHANQTHLMEESGSESDVDEPTELAQPTAASLDIVSPPRPAIHHALSAPAVMTPTPSANAPRPIRSALRNALTPAAAFKKRAGWSDDLTPIGSGRGATPGSSGKRSVSFSDGKKAGKIVEVDVSIHATRWTSEEGVDLFKGHANASFGGTGEGSRSFLPSARTKRIQGLLGNMEELSLEDETPSKPSRQNDRPASRSASPTHSSDSESTVPIRSFRTGRSFRQGNSSRLGDATFLTECSFGVAHDKLVQIITDVQPFEPHWEELRTINLKGKGADSVARLKEFLPKLDEANLDDNVVSYLSGIPSSVRTLHVAGNRLTSLTSVNHLRNLQYLDISRNQLDSVAQLECLKHLRELKADHNAITDLGGIMDMDCLIKLSATNNKVERLDLTRAKWGRMESLNLANNKIREVRELHKLTSAASINLDGNQLETLIPSRPMSAVRVLRFSDNDLSQFDLSLFPKLRTLYADNNRLSHLYRSEPHSAGGDRLENLSMRNQRGVSSFRLSLRDLENVKRLYLSGNALSDNFFPPSPLYALVYLELAACKMSTWPKDFAKKMPNLKVLNMNYNYVKDLSGVKGLKGLRKLTVVGGRLGGEEGADGRGVMEGLKGLTNLEEVDFRMNPSTLSYYFPLLLPNSSATAPQSVDPDRTIVPSSNTTTAVPASKWNSYDSRFRKNLPDEWYSKRLVYRGLVMRLCPELNKLDGVSIEHGERRKAEELLRAAISER
ncbi:hypothetical protein CI109_102347 [Kwoniella shandongensis]|uniref:Uncharacterized protein n=1 Tax=Kwoniella shandongensis TaxID=1734106 RepID=A0A5M6C076_9TREE|nr:uncharacterized protein CI109_003334 [Kwoniella shandongensis]KAA5528434.1 hypothetical protein CI109_003334 [Kwoniella shandongensis]